MDENSLAAPLNRAHSNGNGNGHKSHAGADISAEDFLGQVRDIFCEVTRYPVDILEPHASLEEDLGIDSVKLGEIFAVLRERYGLPTVMDLTSGAVEDGCFDRGQPAALPRQQVPRLDSAARFRCAR